MNRAIAERLTWVIAGLGVLAAAIAYGTHGMVAARSVAAGAAIGVANWLILRYIVGRVVDGNVQKQAGFTLVLVVKMGVLMALVFLLLRAGMVESLPFVLGLSTLIVGALGGSVAHVLTAPAGAQESDS